MRYFVVGVGLLVSIGLWSTQSERGWLGSLWTAQFGAVASPLLSSSDSLPHVELQATPSHSTTAIDLRWLGHTPDGVIKRWTDDTPSISLGSPRDTGYTDTAIVPNTIYYYRIDTAAGKPISNTMPAVYSDISKPFHCPAMVPVAAKLLGVDRTERFVGANGHKTTITIRAPKHVTKTVKLNPCGARADCSDFANIAGAIANNTRVELAAGDFHVFPGNFLVNILIRNVHDVIFSGAGFDPATGIPLTHIYFHNAMAGPPWNETNQGLGISAADRVLVRNISFDWDYPNAIPGTIVDQDSSHQRIYVVDPGYYVPDPTNPPRISAVVGYNLVTGAFDQRGGMRTQYPAVFNPNFRKDGLYYYLIDANVFPRGEGVLGYVSSGAGILVNNQSSNIAFEHVALYGGGGAGLIWGTGGRGLRLSNVVIDKKPDSLLAPGERPRYFALVGDSDSNQTQGSILIENSRFGFVDDDLFYLRGNVVPLTSLASTSAFSVTTNTQLPVAHPPSAKDFLLFLDPLTLTPISSTMPLATWTQTSVAGANTWKASFRPLAALQPYVGCSAGRCPLVNMPVWSSPDFIIRNSCFHDGHSRIFVNTRNGLIENNVFGNEYYGPIALWSDPTFLNEGPGPSNITVTGNKVIGSNWGLTDVTATGKPNGYLQSQGASAIAVTSLASTGFVSASYPWSHLRIDDNFISNTPGAAITVMSVRNGEVNRNIIVDANQVAYAPDYAAKYCPRSPGHDVAPTGRTLCTPRVAAHGAIMLAWDRAVAAKGNIFLGGSKGLFVDASVVSGPSKP